MNMIKNATNKVPIESFSPQALVAAGMDATDANMYSALAVVYGALRSGRADLVEPDEFPGFTKASLSVPLGELATRGSVFADGLSARILPPGVRFFERYFARDDRDIVYAARREILSQFACVEDEQDEKELQPVAGNDVGLFAVALAGLEADGALRVHVGSSSPFPRATLTRDGFCILAARDGSDVRIAAIAPHVRVSLSGTEMALLNGALMLSSIWRFSRSVETAEVHELVSRMWHAILDDNALTTRNEWAAASYAKRAALRVTLEMTPELLKAARVGVRVCLTEFATNWDEFVTVAGGSIDRYGAKVSDLRSLAGALDDASIQPES